MLEKTWKSLGPQGDQTSQSLKEINPEYSLEGLMLKLQYFDHLMQKATRWKRPQCWERLRAGGEAGDRGWDGWVASLTRWTWVWVSYRPGMLWFMGSQGVGHEWATERTESSDTWKWTVQEYTRADKARDFISKGAWAKSNSVREPRTALHVVCSLGFYGCGISFWVVSGQSLCQGPSWHNTHSSAKMDTSEKDSGRTDGLPSPLSF